MGLFRKHVWPCSILQVPCVNHECLRTRQRTQFAHATCIPLMKSGNAAGSGSFRKTQNKSSGSGSFRNCNAAGSGSFRETQNKSSGSGSFRNSRAGSSHCSQSSTPRKAEPVKRSTPVKKT